MSTLLKAGGADINSMSLSISKIHCKRKSAIKSNATAMQDKKKSFAFADMENKYLVLH